MDFSSISIYKWKNSLKFYISFKWRYKQSYVFDYTAEEIEISVVKIMITLHNDNPEVKCDRFWFLWINYVGNGIEMMGRDYNLED